MIDQKLLFSVEIMFNADFVSGQAVLDTKPHPIAINERLVS